MCDCSKCNPKCQDNGKYCKLTAKKLTVCKEAKFKGDVTIYGQFSLKNPVTISVPDLHSGADLSRPTIQEAIDYFSGRHAMNGTILVKPGGGSGPNGSYVETLSVSKLSSAISLDKSEFTAFNLIGDVRPCAGTAYLQNGLNSNPLGAPGMGTDGATVTISSSGNIITIPGVNFTLMGIVPGDRVLVRGNSNDGTWDEVIVASVGTTTLTFTSVPLSVGGYGSAIVLCPNVEVVAADLSTGNILYVSGANLQMKGVRLSTNPGHGSVLGLSNTTLVDHGFLRIENCLFDDSSYATSENNIKLDPFSEIRGFTTKPISSTVIGTGNEGCITVFESICNSGNWNLFDGFLNLNLYQSQLYNDGYLQIVGYGFGSRGVYSEQSIFINYGSMIILNHSTGIQNIGGNLAIGNENPSSVVLIDCSSDGVTNNPGTRGVRLQYSASALFGKVTIKNAFVGIRAIDISNVVLAGAPGITTTFTNNTYNYAIENLSVIQDKTLPGDIFTYTANAIVDNGFLVQKLNSIAPITLTMNPALAINPVGPFSVYMYLGKTFTLKSNNAVAHKLTLTSGAFIGAGVGTVATFSSVNDYIVFTVISTTEVLVTGKSAGVVIA